MLTAIACTVGIAGSAADGALLRPGLALVTVLLAVVAHAAANVWNDCGDAVIGTDAINEGRIEPYTGGSRVIQNGGVTIADMRTLSALLAVAAIAGGLWLTWLRGSGLLAIGLAGTFIGWAYSQPRIALMSRGLGEFAVAASWALVVIGADYVQRGQFAATPFMACVSLSLLVAAVLTLNQIPDIDADRACGKYTLAVRLGPARTAVVYTMLICAAALWLVGAVVVGYLPPATLLALLASAFGLQAAKRARDHARGIEPDLAPALRASVQQALLHGALLAVGLAVAAP